MRTFIYVAALLLLTGCTASVKPGVVDLSSEVTPERLPVKVALILPPGFEQYRYSGRPTSWSGAVYTADIELGSPTVEALRTRLADTFTVVPSATEAEVTVEPAFVSVVRTNGTPAAPW